MGDPVSGDTTPVNVPEKDESWDTPPASFDYSQEVNSPEQPFSVPKVMGVHQQAAPARVTGASPVGKISFGVIGGIALALVLFLTVGLVWADDQGMWNNGLSVKLSFLKLSSIWGGLSTDPVSASSQMDNALKLESNLTFDGKFTGYSKAASIVTDPLAASKNLTLALVSSNALLAYTQSDGGVDVKTEYRSVNGDLYVNGLFGSINSPTDNSKMNQSSWVKTGKAPAITLDVVKSFLARKLAVSSFVGEEHLNSESTYHYRTVASIADVPLLPSLLPETIGSNWQKSTGPLDFWISRKTKLPIQMAATLTRSDVGQSIQILLNLNNTQKITSIVAPEGAVDANATLTPDQHRKADLKKISDALESYYKAVGTYPVSASVEKLSQPDSILNQKLLPTYLDKLPTDPSDPTHYYGYVSNGISYELSAALDSLTDPEGTKSGSLNLYLIKGPVSQSSSSPSPSPQ